MEAIGIDVGGQSIRGGVITKDGKVLEKIVLMTQPEKGRDAVVDNIVKVAKSLLDDYKNVRKIGVGIPGIVDRKGYISFTPNIPFSRFDLGSVLKQKLKRTCVFGNDADNFTLAQQYFGSGKGKKNIIALTLGTGVGSGIVLDGKIFSNNGAPELGHTTINFNGKSKCCGNDGCIESYIGRKSFDASPLEYYKRAVAGNKVALKKFQEYGKYLGIAVSNFINIFNPDIVILGGQMSNAYVFFKETMEAEVKKRALFKTPIKKSSIRGAGMMGAAILTFK